MIFFVTGCAYLQVVCTYLLSGEKPWQRVRKRKQRQSIIPNQVKHLQRRRGRKSKEKKNMPECELCGEEATPVTRCKVCGEKFCADCGETSNQTCVYCAEED